MAPKNETVPYIMSRFDLESVPTAALVWALHDRELDVDALVAPVKNQQEWSIVAGESKVIQLLPQRKRHQGD